MPPRNAPCAFDSVADGASTVNGTTKVDGPATAAWKRASARPELNTWKALFLRNCTVFAVLFVWVGMSLFCLAVSFFTARYYLTHFLFGPATTATAADVLPWPALVGGALLAVYAAAHATIPEDSPWPWLLDYLRCKFEEYPYFEYNAIVFDDDDLKHDASPIKANDKAIFAFHPHG